jgi:hypothetical protein
MERVQSLIDRDPWSVPGPPLGLRLRGLRALAPSSIHRRDREGVSGWVSAIAVPAAAAWSAGR